MLASMSQIDPHADIPLVGWSELSVRPARTAVNAKQPTSSARHTPSGSAWGRSASRSTTPATKRRWQRCERPWVRRTLTPPKPRARPVSTEEAIAYTQHGRGQRKRPTSGWASLTPAERDVVRLVSEGLANNDIATRLFVSPRTVQTHLTHVYTKLGAPPGCNSIKKLNVTNPRSHRRSRLPIHVPAQNVDIVPKRSDRSILLHDFELDLRYATAQFDDQGVLIKQSGAK